METLTGESQVAWETYLRKEMDSALVTAMICLMASFITAAEVAALSYMMVVFSAQSQWPIVSLMILSAMIGGLLMIFITIKGIAYVAIYLRLRLNEATLDLENYRQFLLEIKAKSI